MFLDIFAISSVIAGILVITSSNPVISVLFLVTVFALSSCYLLILNISFVGLTYLIVYVGAVAVLFLFVIIILNIRVSEIVAIGLEHTKSLPLGFLVGILFILEILSLLPAATIEFITSSFTQITAYILNIDITLNVNPVNIIFSGPFADTNFTSFTQIHSIGFNLYTQGSLGLLLASFLLLLSLIGPILTCLHHPNSKLFPLFELICYIILSEVV